MLLPYRLRELQLQLQHMPGLVALGFQVNIDLFLVTKGFVVDDRLPLSPAYCAVECGN